MEKSKLLFDLSEEDATHVMSTIVCGKTAEKEKTMKVILSVGPRNEEMIALVKSILNCTFMCSGFENGFEGETEESIALYQQTALDELAEKCESKDELLDAIYYACGERKDGLEDREAYFQEQMCGDEFGYFIDALSYRELCYN